MKRIIIDSGKNFLRAAVAEDNSLIELIIDDKQRPSIVGNIYTGIVETILPSRFAFVNIGEDKNAFLHLSDPKETSLNIKNGMQITVQVYKDATTTKGPAITSSLSFTGKYMVLIKNNFEKEEIGISKKIEDADQRARLKKIIKNVLQKGYGVIIRTAAEDACDTELEAEYAALMELCSKITERGTYTKSPAIIHRETSVSVKAVKELLTKNIEEIIVNNKNCCEEISEFVCAVKIPAKVIYKEGPVFSDYSLERQIKTALSKKVWLNSGGFLFIEQTEACVVIDVNTGKFTGKKNHANTIILINTEAAIEIARQIQLRNLSGTIIVDFIDMKDENETLNLTKIMETELRKSRVSAGVSCTTESGLMQITRKKTREPIAALLLEDCKCCCGTGKVPRRVL